MFRMICIVAASSFLATVGEANALTLTNRDGVQLRVEVYEEQGEEPRTVVIEPDETLSELCSEGCILSMDSGAEESFEGYETVEIKEGQFVIAE